MSAHHRYGFSNFLRTFHADYKLSFRKIQFTLTKWSRPQQLIGGVLT